MDTFEIRWHQYEKRERKVQGHSFHKEYFHFHLQKKPDENLLEFLRESYENDYYVTIRYIINGEDFADYMNLNYYGHRALDAPGGDFNSLTYHWNRYISEGLSKSDWLNEIFLRNIAYFIKGIKGEKIIAEDLKAWGMDEKDVEFFLEDAKLSFTLYGCCQCLDRECGYWPIDIEKNEHWVKWHLPEMYHKGYQFKKENYLKEFEEYDQLITDLIEKRKELTQIKN
ncbi:hypothetical protein [Flammeovirga sp. SJP92]|uniref:hypothetical protein n=1 Tax=Flammeovirga sp. SJP92 TaxID=1775430 RepID=UPI000787E08B|nr:hypothetical protein [Flammeovirga sp. SJP92]KXX71080.1 hypothetical protein AVL50_10790 [Flammeovirga sp. SJP92]